MLDFLFTGFIETLSDSFRALAPLVVFFLFFQWRYLGLPREYVVRVGKGLVICWLGLALFLHGVNIGFVPAGRAMGEIMGRFERQWVIVIIGLLLGFVATMAEPGVRTLGYEVEKASSGMLKENLLVWTLAVGVAVAVAVGCIRILFGIPLQYILVPGYVLALIMMAFSDRAFASIAFDAGGFATGPMTVTFIMALALGVAEVLEGRNAVVDGFGIVALVALAAIISVLGLGVLFRGKEQKGESDTWSSTDPTT